MTAQAPPPEPSTAEDGLLTIDELAAATGTTVRNTRYYTGLGLLPAPLRRGRVALYGPRHVARLRLIQDLQQHGFTLAAIDRQLAGVPHDATPAELSVLRTLLTAWHRRPRERVQRHELDERAGRRLDEADLAWLTEVGAVRETGDAWEVLPQLRLAVELRDLRVPAGVITAADGAVRRHMGELADELTELFESTVMSRYDLSALTDEEAEELERAVGALGTLTLEAIVASFQNAAGHLATRSLGLGTRPPGPR